MQAFWTVLDLIFTFFCVQVIHMLFWGMFDSSFTFFCMQLSIMMFWIEFDLIFAFFYILHTGDLHCVPYIVLDFISTLCLDLALHAAGHHGVLDCVGLDVHLLLRVGDPLAFLRGFGLYL